MAYMDRALNRRRSQSGIETKFYILVDQGIALSEHPVESTEDLGEAISAGMDNFSGQPFAIYEMTTDVGSRRVYDGPKW